MFVRKKKHRSGNIGVIVAEKICGKMKELVTIGVAYNEGEVDNLVNEAKEWISWRKRSIPTHSGWLYPLTFDAGKGLKEA